MAGKIIASKCVCMCWQSSLLVKIQHAFMITRPRYTTIMKCIWIYCQLCHSQLYLAVCRNATSELTIVMWIVA